MKAELKKSVREIREGVDLEICILKSRRDSLEEKIQTTGSKLSNNFAPDMSIVVMGLPYNDGEDLTENIRELPETGLECDPVPSE